MKGFRFSPFRHFPPLCGLSLYIILPNNIHYKKLSTFSTDFSTPHFPSYSRVFSHLFPFLKNSQSNFFILRKFIFCRHNFLDFPYNKKSPAIPKDGRTSFSFYILPFFRILQHLLQPLSAPLDTLQRLLLRPSGPHSPIASAEPAGHRFGPGHQLVVPLLQDPARLI